MKNETEKWSKGDLKKYLLKDRVEFWRADTIEMLAKWIGLKHGLFFARKNSSKLQRKFPTLLGEFLVFDF